MVGPLFCGLLRMQVNPHCWSASVAAGMSVLGGQPLERYVWVGMMEELCSLYLWSSGQSDLRASAMLGWS